MKKFILMMALAITAGVYTAHAQDVITDPAAAAQAQKEAIKAQKKFSVDLAPYSMVMYEYQL